MSVDTFIRAVSALSILTSSGTRCAAYYDMNGGIHPEKAAATIRVCLYRRLPTSSS